MFADAVSIPVMIFSSAISLGMSDYIPPQNYLAAEPRVELLYKVNGRIVTVPIMDDAAAAAACPNSSPQLARQRFRVDGDREFLVWDLRCR